MRRSSGDVREEGSSAAPSEGRARAGPAGWVDRASTHAATSRSVMRPPDPDPEISRASSTRESVAREERAGAGRDERAGCGARPTVRERQAALTARPAMCPHRRGLRRRSLRRRPDRCTRGTDWQSQRQSGLAAAYYLPRRSPRIPPWSRRQAPRSSRSAPSHRRRRVDGATPTSRLRPRPSSCPSPSRARRCPLRPPRPPPRSHSARSTSSVYAPSFGMITG